MVGVEDERTPEVRYHDHLYIGRLKNIARGYVNGLREMVHGELAGGKYRVMHIKWKMCILMTIMSVRKAQSSFYREETTLICDIIQDSKRCPLQSTVGTPFIIELL